MLNAQTPMHLLIVEDEPVTRMRFANYFKMEGFKVSEAEDAQSMREVMETTKIDLVMLDVNLPTEDGLVLAREIRANSTVGIILVTGRTNEIDRIIGLEVGADDYVTKPVNMRELLARVKNLLRRTANDSVQKSQSCTRKFLDWSFNLKKRQLENKSNQHIKLTRSEFELMSLFTSHPGSVLNRNRIMKYINHREWDPSDRTIDVLIRRLRKKLEVNPTNPEIIITIHGEGYQFSADVV
ncbi:MAG: two-component system response regulator TorR [Pseudomonadales bacterium]